ncbi:MAG: T9SS type A sorting domain-containing protein [Bacteroidales bacterium]|jgi:hypothetical protein
MKKSFFLFLIILFLCFSTNAQTLDSVFSDNNVLVKQSNKSFLLVNGDNQAENIFYTHYADTNKIIKLDDNLNIIDSVVYKSNFSRDLFFKKNNLNYGLYYTAYSNNNLDTVKIYCEDDNGVLLFNTTLYIGSSDTINFESICVNAYNTQGNKSIVLLRNDFALGSNNCKLILVDSVGNIEYSNIFNVVGTPYLFETSQYYNLITSVKLADFGSTYVYNIRKKDLILEASSCFDKCYFFDNVKPINDSLVIISGFDIAIYDTISNNHFEASSILNIHSQTLHSQYFYYTDTIINHGDMGYVHILPTLMVERNFLDYYTTNSIYKYYRFYEYNYTSRQLIGLYNYDLNGGINFFYIVNFGYGSMKQLFGMKATEDGGVILSSNNWIAKVSEDGLLSILNIETQEKESIKVYPNPAKDYINVDIECTNFNNASSIELFDMQGRIVRKEKLKAKQGNRVDVSSLCAGAYTYNVSLNGKTISGKVIVGK